MTISIKYFAILAEYAHTTQETLEIRHNSLDRLFEDRKSKYNFPFDKKDIRVALNTSYVDFSQEIREGDTIVFISPVAGG